MAATSNPCFSAKQSWHDGLPGSPGQRERRQCYSSSSYWSNSSGLQITGRQKPRSATRARKRLRMYGFAICFRFYVTR